MSIKTIVFNYTGANQTFTVPPFVEKIMVKAWGAGGGNNAGQNNGGPGGYSTGTLPVSTSQTLNIMVGQGGPSRSIVTPYGGGGPGGNDTSASNLDGACGGGRSGISVGLGNQLIIAAGGGGSGGGTAQNVWSNGGAGGGLVGIDAWVNAFGNANAPGKGGTQIAGGAGGTFINPPNGNGVAGGAFQGGTGGTCPVGNAGAGGGGGGGYFGGGGGAGQFTITANNLEQDCAGGGGSSYIDATILNGSTSFTPQNTAQVLGGALTLPPNTTDPNYIAGIGRGAGAAFTSGGNGLVVIVYNQPDLIMNKTVSKDYCDVNDTLTYTISINNNGPVTVDNIVFVDTVPTNTTFIPNSFTLDGTSLPVTPNPLGVTIPSLGINATSTIQFSIVIPSTVPSPNSVTNVSTSSYTGGFIFNSNSVTTTINHATLQSTKYSDKSYAFVGDTISYSIALYNTGSVSADNILFLDTIPNGLTFVPSSLSQDGILIIGSPSSPGVNLPNSIGPGLTSTVTFQVNIITIPSPNPVQNSASQTYTYIINPATLPPITGTNSSNTNIVNTTINTARLTMSKSVSKSYATCGDILTYTLNLKNTGNVTATNIFFIDTVPNGLNLVSNSVNIDGTTLPGANPSLGITIPNIAPSGTSTISFNVIVSC